jgi:hypothetical protein
LVKSNIKLLLTPKECADYTHISEQRIRELADSMPDWAMMIGAHLKIKRPLFERWLDTVNLI